MEDIVQDAGKLSRALVEHSAKPAFEFLPLDDFAKIAAKDRAQAARIYWRELLYRSHLAAVTALARHSRWIDAAWRQYDGEKNYLGFASCLRGLLEAAADTFYSLRSVPLTIAHSISMVRTAVAGELSSGGYVAEELEAALIHYLYATHEKGQRPPTPVHQAQTAAAYVKCLTDQNNQSVGQLYEFLCGLTHPSARSLNWMLKTSEDLTLLQFGGIDDRRVVRQLVESHGPAIKLVTLIPLDIAVCTLRVLNLLPLPEVRTGIAIAYEPSSWAQVLALLKKS